jgi:hypothetical protein
MAIDGGANFSLVVEKKGFLETKPLKKSEVIPDIALEDEEEEEKKNEPVVPFVP